MIDAILMSVLLGFVGFFLIEVVRKFPGIAKRALRGERPWGCDLCMTLWMSVLLNVGLGVFPGAPPFSWFYRVVVSWGSAGVCLAVLSWYSSLDPPPGPDLPSH